MNILVTGAAGYIGSAVVKKLCDQDHTVITLDNLSKGGKERVDSRATFYHADLTDKKAVETICANHSLDAVIHFAAYKAVGESMKNAGKYSDNITGTIVLLNAMVKHNVKKMVFSSSAAVYGMPEEDLITEETQCNPMNVYGHTKHEGEQLLAWYNTVHNIQYVSLRYFNVAGDAGLNYIDPNALNIFPIIMEVIEGKREKLTIYGNDYATPDGTCVRDYIDLNDLVEAHIKALAIEYNGPINLGTNKGYSVKELVTTFQEITGETIPHEYGPRREGDPAILVASNEKARTILGWYPRYDLKDMIASTYKAYHHTKKENKEDIALVYMLAGRSKRFHGNIKALTPIGPHGETLLEYSLTQALSAGFTRIIFIVSTTTKEPLQSQFGAEYKHIPITYVTQTYDKTKREKPWGTVDAVCTLQNIIRTPFVLANGDDLVGKNTFIQLADHLKKSRDAATVALPLKNMLPETGTVNRGIFTVDEKNNITDIKEVLSIDPQNLAASHLNSNSLTNMNVFALYPETVNHLAEKNKIFKQQNKNNPDAECLLPVELAHLIKKNTLAMKLYTSIDPWYGITNPGDEEAIRKALKK